jgi:hypothetical protein
MVTLALVRLGPKLWSKNQDNGSMAGFGLIVESNIP